MKKVKDPPNAPGEKEVLDAGLKSCSCENVLLSFTVQEAGKLLRVGKSTIYDGVASGEIPNAGVGKAVRIPAYFIAAKLGVEVCSLQTV